MRWCMLLIGSFTLVAGAAQGQSPRASVAAARETSARLTISVTVVPVTFHEPRTAVSDDAVQYQLAASPAMEIRHEKRTVLLDDAGTSSASAAPLPVVLETTTIVPR